MTLLRVCFLVLCIPAICGFAALSSGCKATAKGQYDIVFGPVEK